MRRHHSDGWRGSTKPRIQRASGLELQRLWQSRVLVGTGVGPAVALLEVSAAEGVEAIRVEAVGMAGLAVGAAPVRWVAVAVAMEGCSAGTGVGEVGRVAEEVAARVATAASMGMVGSVEISAY